MPLNGYGKLKTKGVKLLFVFKVIFSGKSREAIYLVDELVIQQRKSNTAGEDLIGHQVKC